MKVGAWELCLGQELSRSLCSARAVSSLLTFLANRGSSGAGEEGEEAAPRPSRLWAPRPICRPLGTLAKLPPPPPPTRPAGTGTGQALPGPEVTLSTWQVQDSISSDGLKHGPFSLPTALKTVIRCHFPWRPSLSSGAVGIITHSGPSLPCTAPPGQMLPGSFLHLEPIPTQHLNRRQMNVFACPRFT